MRPEQIKAMEYLRDRGSRLAASQVHERVAAGFAALESFLDGITEAEARVRALPGEWSIQEVADHLVETHRPSLEELRDLLAGRRPPGEPIQAGLQSRDPLARPWTELLGELKRLQAEIVAALGAAPDRFNDARAPIVMVINVRPWNAWSKTTTAGRPVAARAYFTAFSSASLPVLNSAVRFS